MDNYLIASSIAMALISPVVYGFSMVNGVSRPARMTRFIIWVAATISLFSLIADGSTGAVWLAGIFSIRSFFLFVMSLKYGLGGWGKIDKASLALSALGLLAWQIFDQPLMALSAAIAADLIGFIPAYVKTWKEPSSEGPWFYVIEAAAVVLNIILIGEWSIDLVFPVYILISGLIMLAIIFLNKR